MLLATLFSASLACCASNSHDAALRAEEPPADFTLAVTTFARPGASRRATLPPERTPARYLLDPSGVLRSTRHLAVNDDIFPPQTRTLTDAQVTQVWTVLQASGFLETNHAASVGRVGPFADPTIDDSDAIITSPPVYSVQFIADGVSRTLSLEGTDSDAALSLVRLLADLSWTVR